MIAELIKNYAQERQTELTTILYHMNIQKFMLNQMRTWNDMMSQRSKIVFNAKFA